ncbi:PREDICTED: basic salivary proline-rich protein 4-like [Chinchilla lanigera]|uniref:basic salivary proline-rich protein 4-like n=1 Tax=Chinchilla lanigera TaxID=34839 RepID=UPI0006975912|nr:PREDICTED: basic salivary proline-rich protein 4-like [Chinchilla lanigera]
MNCTVGTVLEVGRAPGPHPVPGAPISPGTPPLHVLRSHLDPSPLDRTLRGRLQQETGEKQQGQEERAAAGPGGPPAAQGLPHSAAWERAPHTAGRSRGSSRCLITFPRLTAARRPPSPTPAWEWEDLRAGRAALNGGDREDTRQHAPPRGAPGKEARRRPPQLPCLSRPRPPPQGKGPASQPAPHLQHVQPGRPRGSAGSNCSHLQSCEQRLTALARSRPARSSQGDGSGSPVRCRDLHRPGPPARCEDAAVSTGASPAAGAADTRAAGVPLLGGVPQ